MINSRGLALFLGLLISVITTAFLTMVPSINGTALIVSFLLSFSSSYIFIRLAVEFVFFRQIDNIYEALSSIKDPTLNSLVKPKGTSFNPLKRINKEIQQYVDRKQQEILELKQMETFRREFIADVSHELKTPIFAAQGFVHTLLDGAVEDKKVRRKFLKKAAKSLDGLDLLVQDLLTISQMETGEIKMHFENFDIIQMAVEVVDQLEGKADKSKINLVIESEEEGACYVIGDYQRIYQVLINLVSNAIKYGKKEGTTAIKIEHKDENVRVNVIDNGIGIPEEDRLRIFERFYRVDKSRSKEKGGTGLGLAIVKHIMEGHQSKVEVESEPNKGSSFSFELPKGKYMPTRLLEDEDEEDYA